jgi:hypothetical protein
VVTQEGLGEGDKKNVINMESSNEEKKLGG